MIRSGPRRLRSRSGPGVDSILTCSRPSGFVHRRPCDYGVEDPAGSVDFDQRLSGLGSVPKRFLQDPRVVYVLGWTPTCRDG